jgi:hypothetical protein
LDFCYFFYLADVGGLALAEGSLDYEDEGMDTYEPYDEEIAEEALLLIISSNFSIATS